MSLLIVMSEDGNEELNSYANYEDIASSLSDINVHFEQWQLDGPLSESAEQEEVLHAYQRHVAILKRRYDFHSIDVVSLRPDNPDKQEFRAKFLQEHTHDDFEVRFFVDGSGLFYLHSEGNVYMIYCQKGDLISLPADTTHWFDMGENPNFKCIRFFTRDEGWIGKFTGSDIAERFPSYDEFVAKYCD